ncbi:small subunit ribosomal protein S9 [Geosmithia morbida]|uniref:Small ribosomal subunit protein uS9m n=1 Tax=Geosmithia morbida TaxID=1094350 RepID=A0A9P4YPJ6_9HYPO|nr:small subunit ribosomal protein S9 [Geosmithia morbida]KAF4120207.1 small subunit ribosomal protein S9 [Geosmithia morbida]
MASLANGLQCARQLTSRTWQLAVRPKARQLSTTSSRTASLTTTTSTPERDGGASSAAVAAADPVNAIKIPFQNVKHARQVPTLGSYFSREPRFNDLHLRLFNLLAKYHDLPMVESRDAPLKPWLKLEGVRHQTGEPIKAAHFSKVMKVARRLNLIEPSMRPAEVDRALQQLSRPVEATVSFRKPTTVDRHGRAVGVGSRKESTARAFVVEGTGEVLINGKTLSDAFGRVHDRESAIWALTATNRLDKYNVWVIARGGGTTGQAEAITMAIANGLVAHEPSLKTALRAAGCITRDARKVERKKHGHLKARKSPAWVKR